MKIYKFELKHIFYFLLALTVIFSEGFHRPDEHLGMLRMVMLKMESLPSEFISWEIPAQIRSWAQPGFYYFAIKFFKLLGIEAPWLYALLLRLLTATFYLISIQSLKKSLNMARPSYYNEKTFELIIHCTWFLPFIMVRTSTEAFCAILLNFIFAAVFKNTYNHHFKFNLNFAFLLSFLTVFCVFSRIQSVLVLAPLFLLLLMKYHHFITLKWLLQLSLFTLLAVLANVLIDYWGYGVWTLTPYNNLYQNLVLGVASGFGKSPWYYYLEKFVIKGIPVYSVPLLVFFAIYGMRKPLSILCLPVFIYFVGHSFVAHKELRFLYPIATLAALTFSLGIERWKERFFTFRFQNIYPIAFKAFVLINLGAMAIVSVRPAYGIIGFYNYIYEKKVKTVVTLNVVRDPLVFYMGRNVNFEYITTENLEEALSFSLTNNVPLILTDKYDQHLNLNRICQNVYLSSPVFIFKYFKKIAERSKIWGLYDCSNFKGSSSKE